MDIHFIKKIIIVIAYQRGARTYQITSAINQWAADTFLKFRIKTNTWQQIEVTNVLVPYPKRFYGLVDYFWGKSGEKVTNKATQYSH